jgi:predicted DCC family thiol-disulfide oxidoreductase YuxK
MDPAMAPDPTPAQPIVLYDGVCGLCAHAVRFLLGHELGAKLVFAPLQGETAARLRIEFPQIPGDLSTVVLVDNGKIYTRAKAFLHVARYLKAPWRWAYAVRWIPGPLLNPGYRLVAALRYRIWGKTDACHLPSPTQRVRFLP